MHLDASESDLCLAISYNYILINEQESKVINVLDIVQLSNQTHQRDDLKIQVQSWFIRMQNYHTELLLSNATLVLPNKKQKLTQLSRVSEL